MKIEEKINTGNSIPEGTYVIETESNFVSVNNETEDDSENPYRTLKVTSGKNSANSSFRFIVDVEKEEESKLLTQINKLLKRINK
jgi:hypothetical protein